MASLEKRGQSYRVVFRFARQKFTRALSTTSETAADATLARLEDNLRRVHLGTLSIPEGADVATFLLSDGKKVTTKPQSSITTLTGLFDAYFDRCFMLVSFPGRVEIAVGVHGLKLLEP